MDTLETVLFCIVLGITTPLIFMLVFWLFMIIVNDWTKDD